MNRIFLPPYSPELNPAEWIFEEARREIEGFVYPSLQAKQHRIEQFLRRLRADKDRLASLVSWDWITHIFNQLLTQCQDCPFDLSPASKAADHNSMATLSTATVINLLRVISRLDEGPRSATRKSAFAQLAA